MLLHGASLTKEHGVTEVHNMTSQPECSESTEIRRSDLIPSSSRHVLSACCKLLSCPGQVPMGAHSSSTKKEGGAVTQRKSLNGSTIPAQGPTPNVQEGTKSTCIVASSVLPKKRTES